MSWLGLGVLFALTPVLAVTGVLSWLLLSRVRWVQYQRHKGRLDRPPGLAALLDEIRAVIWIAWWKVGVWGAERILSPEGAASGPPVLCVHGFTQDATNFRRLRRALAARGRPSVAVSMGRPFRPVEAYAARLTQALRALRRHHPRVDIVAHSMGGIILRHVLATHPDLREGVRRVVTLGTPHQGTAAVRGTRLMPERLILGRRSPWLAALPTLGALVPQAHRFTVAGGADLVVYPGDTCHEPSSIRIDLPDVGHAGLLTRPEAIEVVVRALEAEA